VCLVFSVTFVSNVSHSKKNWAGDDKKVCWSLCKMPTIHVRFFPTDFWKILISDFKTIGPVGAELFHAGGRTDGRTDGQTCQSWWSFFALLRTRITVGNIYLVLAANIAMKYVILQWEVHAADIWCGIWLQIVEVLRIFQHSQTVLQQV